MTLYLPPLALVLWVMILWLAVYLIVIVVRAREEKNGIARSLADRDGRPATDGDGAEDR